MYIMTVTCKEGLKIVATQTTFKELWQRLSEIVGGREIMDIEIFNECIRTPYNFKMEGSS